MTVVQQASEHRAKSSELISAVQDALDDHFGSARRIVHMYRRQSEYSSSFPIEELEVELADGTRVELIFKDLSRKAMLDEASRAKPHFLFNPLREIEAYRMLAPHELGTPGCFGASVCRASDRYWLFLEKAAGVQLHQIGTFSVWQAVARWLAGMHSRLSGEVSSHRSRRNLVQYTPDFYRTWLARARANVAHDGSSPLAQDRRMAMARVASGYDHVVDRLAALPRTIIHGEFYASNVLVHLGDGEPRICPVDWETAGVGPALIDLAALTAGNWCDAQKTSLAMAYYDAMPPDRPPREEFLTSLAYCELHWAVLWVGWARRWQPPPEHARDWLRRAASLTEQTSLSP